jgi:uncharacterized protein involved in response to NO
MITVLEYWTGTERDTNKQLVWYLHIWFIGNLVLPTGLHNEWSLNTSQFMKNVVFWDIEV